MRLYGGLKKWMPTTYWTYLVATLAIAGLFPLSGFMSKDAILAESLFNYRGSWILWIFGSLAAVMTSFYMFRSVYMTFHGQNRSPEHVREHLKESPKVMTGVLATLAIGAVVVGFIGVPVGVTALFKMPDINLFHKVLHPVVAAQGVVAAGDQGHGHDGSHAMLPESSEPRVLLAAETHDADAHHAVTPDGVIPEGMAHPSWLQEFGLFSLAFVIFIVGFLLARWSYAGDKPRADELAPKLGFVRRLLHRKWFVDELYGAVLIRPFRKLSEILAGFDARIVDGAVNLTAATAEFSGQVIKLFQTGIVRQYALWFMAGAVVLLWAMLG
jgi:NADH-quinone oxidoreductase subunit L